MSKRFRVGKSAEAALRELELEHIVVGDDEGGEIRFAVADDHGLEDERVFGQKTFEIHWGDVLAAEGDEDFFFAAGDVEEAVGVLAAEIAGGEPSVMDHFTRGGVV